jgi:hypothetical protein
MRLVWMILFIVLLLCQLIAFMAGGIPQRRVPPVAAAADPDLLELAMQLRDAWIETIDPAMELADAGSRKDVGTVLEREQLMLQLRDVQEVLSSLETEVRIAGELDAWLTSSSGDLQETGGRSTVLPYMAGLLGWLRPFLEPDGGVVMERSFLVPESNSAYPSLSFELKGDPHQLGSCLLEYEERFGGWRLSELELNRDGDSSSWWLRGSYAFGGDGL